MYLVSMSEQIPGSFPPEPKYHVTSATGMQYAELPSDIKRLIAEKTFVPTRNELRATHKDQLDSDYTFERDSKRFRQEMEEMRRTFPGAFPQRVVQQPEEPVTNFNFFEYVADQLIPQDLPQVQENQVPGSFQNGGCDTCGGGF